MDDIYTYKETGPLSCERMLVCPECGELLEHSDVEMYSCCPFCNYKFEADAELEDFILEPLVERWIRQQNPLMPMPSPVDPDADSDFGSPLKS